MEDILCEICGKELVDKDKVIVLSGIPCWEDENRRFFCCQQHADTYTWELARQGVSEIKDEIFWDTTVDDLVVDFYEY